MVSVYSIWKTYLITAYFVCDLIHNITFWGYYLIGERLCHGTHGLPYTNEQAQFDKNAWFPEDTEVTIYRYSDCNLCIV